MPMPSSCMCPLKYGLLEGNKKIVLEMPMYDSLYVFCTKQAPEGPVF